MVSIRMGGLVVGEALTFFGSHASHREPATYGRGEHPITHLHLHPPPLHTHSPNHLLTQQLELAMLARTRPVLGRAREAIPMMKGDPLYLSPSSTRTISFSTRQHPACTSQHSPRNIAQHRRVHSRYRQRRRRAWACACAGMLHAAGGWSIGMVEGATSWSARLLYTSASPTILN